MSSSSTDSAERDEFDFDGRLLFNKVCQTDRSSGSSIRGTPREIESRMLDRLYPFEGQGTSENPDDGYERYEFRDYVRDAELDLPEPLVEYATSLSVLKYKYEEYSDVEREIEPGQTEMTKIKQIQDVDIFWSYPGHMFFRGADGPAGNAKDETQSALAGEIGIQTRNLGRDFLLWLFYHYCHEDTISTSLDFDRLINGRVTGGQDIFGESNTNKHNDDLKYNAPTLIGLLLTKKFDMVEGDLILEGETKVRTEIATDKVQIKSSKRDLKGASKIVDMICSLAIVREISELHERWDNLGPKGHC